MGQFTVYSSTDASGPGPITGTVGALLTVFDACLVNGYSGKTAAGWSKPFANASNIGCYKQGTGTGSPTQFTLLINDSTASGSATDSYACGWTTITSVASTMGTGTGQFPTPTQFPSFGQVGVRKSATANSTARQWTIFADARTVYMFILTGDTATNYFDFMFGDFYSLAGSSDPNRCMLIGRNTVGFSSITTTAKGIDCMTTPFATSGQFATYIANNLAGTSGSEVGYTFGDIGKSTTSGALTSTYSPLNGSVPSPNPFDNSYYLSPIFVAEASWGLRGQLRGIYHVCHATSSFANGMTFSGVGDFAGKSFTILSPGMGGGIYCMETSNTVNTN